MTIKKICKQCGKEFDPNAPAEDNRCRYHPQKAEHVGKADMHHDYSEVYKYPCCGQLEFPQYTAAEPIAGCLEGVHEEAE
jgi:hypothetical protein